MWGMDVEQGRDYARRIGNGAEQVAELVTVLEQLMSTVDWLGPDADAFRQDFGTLFLPKVRETLTALHSYERELLGRAGRQEDASG